MDNYNFKDYFSSNSNNYAAYRPSYPKTLAVELSKLCKNTNLALDCGCGTGQLSILLAEQFDFVIGTDASQSQIENAKQKDNICYKTATAENSGLDAQSIDLISVAQAAHWLNLEEFYKEVVRIAKPNAILALITYGILHVDNHKVDEVIQEFYYRTIGSYWPEERKHVENGYEDLLFPFHKCPFPKLNMEEFWSLDELINYMSTWSAVKEAQKKLDASPLHQLKAQLEALWGNPDSKKKITWPLSVKVGKVKVE
ncbi:class I SAM-dependent methyltransferase [Acinetobacter nectaris]|uniref:class I SAM-dependent methyltransferase n=1 Tax=Acinetobacter nectaris TaxID=1219382 RepID=UPI001F478AA1|nr:class I SAM-dependent methyltransferase [Acinetobacter nectaris]MCF9034105.1 class I SAM-dependent methyltransferase [Acinetobacter nectaris]